jgi:trans-aconitate 2-methyltransferase
MSSGAEFQSLTCDAPLPRTARMASIADEMLPASVQAVLDLGCGTGRLARLLARARPDASVIGLDVSPANIAAAVGNPDQLANLRFHCGDYLQFDAGPFDAIITDGVLHLIPGSTDVLFGKLAADLTAGGRLIVCMPYRGPYNVAFSLTRRTLRAIRTPALDRAIEAVGRLLHGAEMSIEQLRERVHYMYLPPTRMMSEDIERGVAHAHGLTVIGRYAMPSTSAAQLRHSVTVFEKSAAPTPQERGS